MALETIFLEDFGWVEFVWIGFELWSGQLLDLLHELV
jgi:hypothetical protein